jgi:hypothetical protein
MGMTGIVRSGSSAFIDWICHRDDKSSGNESY